jgi:Spy/CpxP family protein refolding chaperone
MAKVRTEMATKRMELQTLFREPTLDQAKIAAEQKELTTLQAQMQEKGLAARTAVAEVLTHEQRAQMPAVSGRMLFGGPRGAKSGMGFRW